MTIAHNELVFLAQLITLLPAFFLHLVKPFCNVLTLTAEITTFSATVVVLANPQNSDLIKGQMHLGESSLGCLVDHRPGLAQKLFSHPKRQSIQSYTVLLNCKHVGLRTSYGCKGEITKSLQVDYSSG